MALPTIFGLGMGVVGIILGILGLIVGLIGGIFGLFVGLIATLIGGIIAIIGTGIKVQLEIDKVLELYPRSSIAETQELIFVNTVGIVDADYYNNEKNEGHILVLYRNLGKKPAFIKQGERFCQGIIKQYFTVDGDKPGQGPIRKGGLGSTGR